MAFGNQETGERRLAKAGPPSLLSCISIVSVFRIFTSILRMNRISGKDKVEWAARPVQSQSGIMENGPVETRNPGKARPTFPGTPQETRLPIGTSSLVPPRPRGERVFCLYRNFLLRISSRLYGRFGLRGPGGPRYFKSTPGKGCEPCRTGRQARFDCNKNPGAWRLATKKQGKGAQQTFFQRLNILPIHVRFVLNSCFDVLKGSKKSTQRHGFDDPPLALAGPGEPAYRWRHLGPDHHRRG